MEKEIIEKIKNYDLVATIKNCNGGEEMDFYHNYDVMQLAKDIIKGKTEVIWKLSESMYYYFDLTIKDLPYEEKIKFFKNEEDIEYYEWYIIDNEDVFDYVLEWICYEFENNGVEEIVIEEV